MDSYLSTIPTYQVISRIVEELYRFSVDDCSHRKFAPYVDYEHDWTFGETADPTGETSSEAFVGGVRAWR